MYKYDKVISSQGHFTHEPRAVTMKLWKPIRKWSKAVPRHLQNLVVWSRIFKCSMKSYVTGLSTKCYLNALLFVRVLTHDKMKWINSCERLDCHGLLVFCYACLQEVVFENNPSDHETWSVQRHVGTHVETHVDFTSILLHALTMLVLQAESEANLDRLRLFHQWECLKCIGHTLSVSCVSGPYWWFHDYNQDWSNF